MPKGPLVSGVLLLDKAPDISSNGALGKARRLFGAAKAGHTGTLDPFATGLLPIAFGEASKFSRFLLDASKGYTALIKLGVRTSTGDTEGEVIERIAVAVDRSSIESVLHSFVGSRQQVPPMHSALKRDGVPLYKLARQGIEVERAPRDITIHELRLLGWDGVDELRVTVLCSKGTYIRVLGEDIAKALGSVAHLTQLRRTHVGGLKLDAAMTLDTLEALTPTQRVAKLLPRMPWLPRCRGSLSVRNSPTC